MTSSSGSGDLPQHAKERLHQMMGEGGHRKLFTSDLTVNEFLLVKECGFEPLGMVVGTSIYHIGFQQAKWTQNMEMEVLTQAMYHARELAMTRMEEEAHELGADGVVAVRLTVKHMSWNSDIAEFVAIGTAVRHVDNDGKYKALNGRPFTSDLSRLLDFAARRISPGRNGHGQLRLSHCAPDVWPVVQIRWTER
jgi:uncharacterized protein YbjQ (UPF0145 family)